MQATSYQQAQHASHWTVFLDRYFTSAYVQPCTQHTPPAGPACKPHPGARSLRPAHPHVPCALCPIPLLCTAPAEPPPCAAAAAAAAAVCDVVLRGCCRGRLGRPPARCVQAKGAGACVLCSSKLQRERASVWSVCVGTGGWLLHWQPAASRSRL